MKNISGYRDEKIIEIIRTKNNEYYAEIIKRYQSKLLRYATYLVKNEDRAADVVQNAFIKVYINLNSFDSKKKFSSWIYRITHNEAMNIIKKHKKEVVMPEDFDGVSKVDLEKEYGRKEMKEMIMECLDNMALKYREPLSLYYLEEKSYVEISDILRLPIGTVGTRINRGKLLMKKLCQKKGR